MYPSSAQFWTNRQENWHGHSLGPWEWHGLGKVELRRSRFALRVKGVFFLHFYAFQIIFSQLRHTFFRKRLEHEARNACKHETQSLREQSNQEYEPKALSPRERNDWVCECKAKSLREQSNLECECKAQRPRERSNRECESNARSPMERSDQVAPQG